MDSIYLDHNATTPIHPEVVEAMTRTWAEGCANPASQHRPGQRARRVLEDARDEIAAILGADLAGPQPDRLILTSGGTEANNLAVRGIARAAGSAPGHLVISAVEHASVIGAAEHLMDQGWRVDTLAVTVDGLVRTERLRERLAPQTRLVSVTAANHEIGTLEPIAELAAIANETGVPLHTDAVQMAGKLPVRFRAWGVAAMSIAAHKFHGPLGIGALLVRHGVPLSPILFGGHQQDGLRPGTESAALAVGMLTALRIWQREQDELARRMTALRDRFEAGLRAGWPELIIHAAAAPRLPQTSNVAFPGLDGQVLFTALDLSGVACSIGSACSSGSSELSPTLRALGLPTSLVASSLRFSLGSTTTEAEVDEAVRRILQVCGQLCGD
jgi:cysteine desulfurase